MAQPELKIDGFNVIISNESVKFEMTEFNGTPYYSLYNNSLFLQQATSALLIQKGTKIYPLIPWIDKSMKTYNATKFNENLGSGFDVSFPCEFRGEIEGKLNFVQGKIHLKYYLSINGSILQSYNLPYLVIRIELDQKNSHANDLNLYGYAPLFMKNKGVLKLTKNSHTDPKNLTFYSNGWQSWSFNYLLRYEDKWPSSAVSMARINLENQDQLLDARYISEMHTIITDTTSQSALAIGFITHKDQFTRILMDRLKENGNIDWLCAYSQTDGIPIGQLNENLKRSESLLITLHEPPIGYETLTEICRISGVLANVKIPSQVLAGWCSWYYYYTKVKETDVLSNLKFFAENRGYPLSLIQLDDGYQTCIGDWGVDGNKFNEKFPQGLKWLVDQIHEANFKAGLWVAPLFTTKKSQLYNNHPDWTLCDKSGKPINTLYNWHAMQHGLDVSRDDVKEHVRNLAYTVGHQWGFDFLKIDFIFTSAALNSQYKNKSLSRAQVIRRGIEAVREGLGPEKTLLGCGAPLGPSIGLVDVMRIGMDTAANWAPLEWLVKPIAKVEQPSLKPALRAAIQRSYMHNTLWINDPDCVIVRENNSKLTMAEILLQLTIFGLSGGQIIISDDEPLVSPERMALLNRILPPFSTPTTGSNNSISEILPYATPLDIFVNLLPMIYAKSVSTVFGTRHLVALINWEKQSIQRTVKPMELITYKDRIRYQSNQNFLIFDYWNEKIIGKMQLEQICDCGLIDPHGCRYFSLIPITEDTNTQLIFLSSTLHIMQGAMELKKQKFTNDQLSIELQLLGHHKGVLYFLIPEKYEKATGNDLDCSISPTQYGKLLKINLEILNKKDIEIQFG